MLLWWEGRWQKRKITGMQSLGPLRWSWSELGEVQITGIALNTFLLEFKEENGAEHAIEEGP